MRPLSALEPDAAGAASASASRAGGGMMRKGTVAPFHWWHGDATRAAPAAHRANARSFPRAPPYPPKRNSERLPSVLPGNPRLPEEDAEVPRELRISPPRAALLAATA